MESKGDVSEPLIILISPIALIFPNIRVCFALRMFLCSIAFFINPISSSERAFPSRVGRKVNPKCIFTINLI